MFCSPQPVGTLNSESRPDRAGSITSPGKSMMNSAEIPERYFSTDFRNDDNPRTLCRASVTRSSVFPPHSKNTLRRQTSSTSQQSEEDQSTLTRTSTVQNSAHPLSSKNLSHRSNGQNDECSDDDDDKTLTRLRRHDIPDTHNTNGGVSSYSIPRTMSKVPHNYKIVNKFTKPIKNRSDGSASIIEDDDNNNNHGDWIKKISAFSFILPNVYDRQRYSEKFGRFLHRDLIDTWSLEALEKSGHLNWWFDCRACRLLLPIITSGDGNCLLHAASMAMWGVHDRHLSLRQSLEMAMHDSIEIKRRWKWSQEMFNRQVGDVGLQLSEEEWEAEWAGMLQLASSAPIHTGGRNDRGRQTDSPVTYESLTELHVFVLAHVLWRPIIVVADTMLYNSSGVALSPVPFGGIYLPLERNPSECHKVPLLLVFNCSHFSALVPIDNYSEQNQQQSLSNLADAIPLVNSNLELLTVHYIFDPGSLDFNVDETLKRAPAKTDVMNTLDHYLPLINVKSHQQWVDNNKVEPNHNPKMLPNPKNLDDYLTPVSTKTILCADLSKKQLPEQYHEYIGNYMKDAMTRFSIIMTKSSNLIPSNSTDNLINEEKIKTKSPNLTPNDSLNTLQNEDKPQATSSSKSKQSPVLDNKPVARRLPRVPNDSLHRPVQTKDSAPVVPAKPPNSMSGKVILVKDPASGLLYSVPAEKVIARGGIPSMVSVSSAAAKNRRGAIKIKGNATGSLYSTNSSNSSSACSSVSSSKSSKSHSGIEPWVNGRGFVQQAKRQFESSTNPICITQNCAFYSTSGYDNLCSNCYNKRQSSETENLPPNILDSRL